MDTKHADHESLGKRQQLPSSKNMVIAALILSAIIKQVVNYIFLCLNILMS